MRHKRGTATAWAVLLVASAACASGRNYHDSNMDFGSVRTVIVLPFTNLSRDAVGAERLRDAFAAALLATVQRYLERRRLLSGEIHVIGPHYTTVAVSARLQARQETDRRALVRQARGALEAFFHPLRGGPEGRGWPVGRAVYRSELLALLNDLEGVLYVDELNWSVDGQPASRCGNIDLCPHSLVASGIHEIKVNEGSACHE